MTKERRKARPEWRERDLVAVFRTEAATGDQSTRRLDVSLSLSLETTTTTTTTFASIKIPGHAYRFPIKASLNSSMASIERRAGSYLETRARPTWRPRGKSIALLARNGDGTTNFIVGRGVAPSRSFDYAYAVRELGRKKFSEPRNAPDPEPKSITRPEVTRSERAPRLSRTDRTFFESRRFSVFPRDVDFSKRERLLARLARCASVEAKATLIFITSLARSLSLSLSLSLFQADMFSVALILILDS